MANTIDFGYRDRARDYGNYALPWENPYKAEREARRTEKLTHGALNNANPVWAYTAMGDLQRQAQSMFNPSQYMSMAENNLTNVQDAVNTAGVEAEQVYNSALERAKRESSRRGKSLSAADIRKAAIAGAAGKAGAMNRARTASNNERFRQLMALADMDRARRGQGMTALGQTANLDFGAGRLQLGRADRYDRLAGEGSQYYGMNKNRTMAIPQTVNPGQPQNVDKNGVNLAQAENLYNQVFGNEAGANLANAGQGAAAAVQNNDQQQTQNQSVVQNQALPSNRTREFMPGDSLWGARGFRDTPTPSAQKQMAWADERKRVANEYHDRAVDREKRRRYEQKQRFQQEAIPSGPRLEEQRIYADQFEPQSEESQVITGNNDWIGAEQRGGSRWADRMIEQAKNMPYTPETFADRREQYKQKVAMDKERRALQNSPNTQNSPQQSAWDYYSKQGNVPENIRNEWMENDVANGMSEQYGPYWRRSGIGIGKDFDVMNPDNIKEPEKLTPQQEAEMERKYGKGWKIREQKMREYNPEYNPESASDLAWAEHNQNNPNWGFLDDNGESLDDFFNI